MTTSTKTRKLSQRRPDVAQIVTARILDQLKTGTVPWQRPWSTSGFDPFPKNLATGVPYRGINVTLLWSASYSAPWWITYNQAQSLGGQVRKGEHSAPIVVWKQRLKRLRTQAQIDEARGEGREIVRHPRGGLAAKLVFGRIYRVFNVTEQVQGLDDHPLLQTTKREPDWDPIPVCEDLIARYPDRPQIETGGISAHYDPQRDRVRMPDRHRFATATGWHAALFHELVHSTGHPRRLNRPDLAQALQRDNAAYAREELTAEIGAAFLCAHARIDTPDLHQQQAAYLDGWRRRITDDPKLVLVAAQRAQKATDHILDAQSRAGKDEHEA
jgi:antirestriction protein ArdC